MTNDERAQIRAETIAEIADWLEAEYPLSISGELIRKKWLPKPDPAKELVEEYEEWAGLAPRRYYTNAVFRMRLDCFVRWLIDTGKLKA